jgi:hypothetical protein
MWAWRVKTRVFNAKYGFQAVDSAGAAPFFIAVFYKKGRCRQLAQFMP